MSLRIPKPLRAVSAALALTAYVLPAAVGFTAQMGHGAAHALAWIQLLERRAWAMGLTHLHDQPDRDAHLAFVHAHGGASHAHDAGVGVLLVAAEDVDEHGDETAVTHVELSSHVPAAGALPDLAAVERPVSVAEPASAAPGSLLPPPLPPPRA